MQGKEWFGSGELRRKCGRTKSARKINKRWRRIEGKVGKGLGSKEGRKEGRKSGEERMRKGTREVKEKVARKEKED